MPEKGSSNHNGIKSIHKMLENPIYANKLILKDMLPVKQSTVILDFAKPLLDKIDASKKVVLEKTLGTAIAVWNSCIVVNRACNNVQEDGRRLYKIALTAMGWRNLSGEIKENDY